MILCFKLKVKRNIFLYYWLKAKIIVDIFVL